MDVRRIVKLLAMGVCAVVALLVCLGPGSPAPAWASGEVLSSVPASQPVCAAQAAQSRGQVGTSKPVEAQAPRASGTRSPGPTDTQAPEAAHREAADALDRQPAGPIGIRPSGAANTRLPKPPGAVSYGAANTRLPKPAGTQLSGTANTGLPKLGKGEERPRGIGWGLQPTLPQLNEPAGVPPQAGKADWFPAETARKPAGGCALS